MRSYYALEDFGVRHYQAVSEKLGLKVTRLPSDTTFRRILEKLDFQTLAQQFEQWADSTFDTEPGEWVAIDGKSIRGTVIEHRTAYQNFVNMVSVTVVNKESCLPPNSLSRNTIVIESSANNAGGIAT
jgi:hypothetical protein